jgi:hypothetical protein
MKHLKRGANHVVRGTVREDGMIFWSFAKEKEIWITKQQYEKREKTRKAYVKKCRESYARRQLAKHPVDRNFIGKYDFSTNLYFLRMSSSGKEVWGSKEQLIAFRNKHTKYRTRMYNRLKTQHPKTGLKVGDKNPENSNQYVIFFIGNKPYFGTKYQLVQRKKSRKISYNKRNEKYAINRQRILENLQHRIKRGTTDPKTGLVFYMYAQNGKERWITPERYQQVLEIERIRKKRNKKKQYINSCKDLENFLDSKNNNSTLEQQD